MSMLDRMDDAQFNIKTPICLFCKNIIRHKFDMNNPHAPIITCVKLGGIPQEIHYAKSFKCTSFDVDEEEYEINKPFLPKDFNVDEVNK